MSQKAISFDSAGHNYGGVVMIGRIIRLSKSDDGEITFIHLDNGEVLESGDSMRTLEARINSDSE